MDEGAELASLFRWFAVAVVAANLTISAVFRHRSRRVPGRPARRDESPGVKALRAGLGLPALAGLLVYAVNPAWMRWAEVPLPVELRWAGVVLAISSVPLLYRVLEHLGLNVTETVLTREGHVLVTSGPYRWVRHPLYSGAILMWTGISLIAASAFFALLTVLTVIVWLAVVIPLEEAALVDAFGEEYVAYRRRTGRLLPALFRRARLDTR